MINDLPTVFEVVTGSAKKQSKEKSSVSNHSSNKSKTNSTVPELPKIFSDMFTLYYRLKLLGDAWLVVVFIRQIINGVGILTGSYRFLATGL